MAFCTLLLLLSRCHWRGRCVHVRVFLVLLPHYLFQTLQVFLSQSTSTILAFMFSAVNTILRDYLQFYLISDYFAASIYFHFYSLFVCSCKCSIWLLETFLLFVSYKHWMYVLVCACIKCIHFRKSLFQCTQLCTQILYCSLLFG